LKNNRNDGKKLRVLHVLEATIGGTKKHILQLLRNMPKERYDQSLLCSTLRTPSFQPEVERLRAEGFKVYVIRMQRDISPISDVMAFARLWKHLLGRKYDIVHAHSSKAGILARLAAALAGVETVIYSPHGYAFISEPPGLRLLFYKLAEKAAARVTDMTVAVSRSELEAALEANVCRPDRIRVIENGLSEEEMKLPRTRSAKRTELGVCRGELLVGSVGRLSTQKNMKAFIEAASTIALTRRNVKFVIAGLGPELLALERQVIDLRVAQQVMLLGEVDDVSSLYAAMDVFVLPSLWEGLPYALLEAMAVGKPVVATDVPGTRDVVQNERNGLLVPPGNPAALAAAIERLLNDEALRRRLGRAAMSSVRDRFRLDRMIAEMDALYQQIARGVKPRIC